MNKVKSRKVRILHCVPAAAGETTRQRIGGLIAALGSSSQHDLAHAEGNAKSGILEGFTNNSIRYVPDFPVVQGGFGPRRLLRLAHALQGYDLVFTYGWPLIDLVIAHTLFREKLALSPLFHHEDGGPDWAGGSEAGLRRKWYRRLAMGRITGTIVGSHELAAIAVRDWQQPNDRVHRIPIGIDTAAFSRSASPNALRVVKREGECWIGTVMDTGSDCDWETLVGSLARLPPQWHLVVIGDSAARDVVLAAAAEFQVSHRVHLPGAVRDRAAALALFDIFVIPPGGPIEPMRVAEAMATGLPIAGSDRSPTIDLIAAANRDVMTRCSNGSTITGMLERLAADTELRLELGRANRNLAQAELDRAFMTARYRRLLERLLGHEL